MNHEKIVVELELDDILPNRFQPRFKFPEQAITELAESIKEHGVIQPILVRRLGDKYEIIAGERRYKASLLAGKRTIPAIIAELNDKDSAEVALIENVQRQDLTPIEEAVSYRKILDMGYLTQEQLAVKLGKKQSTISNKLRLLNLDDEVQEALLDEKISERHARSLLKIDSKQKQREILQRIISERLTVKKTDELIEQVLSGKTNEDSKTVEPEIPSIFMSNSVQVEEPAIQSSSAIEFINPNDQVVNSFNNSQDEDLLNFLNVDNNANSQPSVPIEGISEISVVDDLNSNPQIETKNNEIEDINANKFDIPTSPIIEEIESEPMVQAPVNNNDKELNEINEIINNLPNANEINPGFVDVDKIEKNAKDIYVEKPLADIDNLLMSENSANTSSIDNFNNYNLDEEVEPVQKNKFFTMVTPEEADETSEVQTEESNNEEAFNFTPMIENSASLNQFLNNEDQSASEDNSLQETNLNNTSMLNTFEQFSVEDNSNKSETNEPLIVPNIEDLQDTIEEIDDSPKTINYPADNILAESIRKEEFVETKMAENPLDTAIDLKTVINTIRNCSETIEKYGFSLECEEYDFEDMYQVIFKIQKKDKM